MMKFKPALLLGAAFGLEVASGRESLRRLDPLLQGARPAFGPAQRIPAQAKAVAEHQQEYAGPQHQQGPGGRPRQPRRKRRHGNAFRSSSKWGPSRRVGQSPPQITGVP